MSKNLISDFDMLFVAAEATKGNMTTEQAHAIIQMSSGKAGLFKNNGQKLNVLDANDEPLIVGKRYLQKRRDEERVIMIVREQLGSGNIMDTYYHVYFICGAELEESRFCVKGKGTIFSGFTYQSNFKPTVEKK